MEIQQEGRAAFRGGIASDRSPYVDADEKLQWMRGWFAAETEFREARAADERRGPLGV